MRVLPFRSVRIPRPQGHGVRTVVSGAGASGSQFSFWRRNGLLYHIGCITEAPQTACGREVMKGSVMIDTIATFLSTVVELLQSGITGFVDAVAGLFV